MCERYFRYVPIADGQAACNYVGTKAGARLYADMGHFGAKPVRLAWYGLVCPTLIINYFGQGALVLRAALRRR